MKIKLKSCETLLVSKDSLFLKIAFLKNSEVWQFFRQSITKQEPLQDDIYLGKVIRITPQFVWVDIGMKTPGVLKIKPQQNSLSEGQKIIVQISKEETKDAVVDKGSRLTQSIYLAGKFCVYHPFEKKLSFSQNLSETTQENILSTFKDKIGFTFRSACEPQTDISVIKNEMEFLEENWCSISKSFPSKAGLIQQGPTLLERLIRDATSDLEIVFDEANIFAALKKNLSQFNTDISCSFRLATLKERPLFEFYGVQEEWDMLIELLVPLAGGGNLYIEETACATTIDVNAGEKSPEEINFEAIKPIIKQIRLRQLSGNILIDFVRFHHSHRKKLLQEFQGRLENENPQNVKVVGWSHLGFLELQAPRHRDSLTKQLIQK